MAGWRIMTVPFWALVGGFVTPLILSTIYLAILIHEPNMPTLPLLPLALMLPPLLVIGMFISYALRKPRSAAARFALGLVLGALLMAVGETGAFRF